ncbi:hypothetical protein AKO1_004894 [Acrasis kona]|uniref:PiggyBac transposable element-derived protein domain-containing protein n=1 Tax=Acrasis kona TaxID=1008807 RepID=A0AAW2YHB2_9EUKA
MTNREADAADPNIDVNDQAQGKPATFCTRKGCKCKGCKCVKVRRTCDEHCACKPTECENRGKFEEFKEWGREKIKINFDIKYQNHFDADSGAKNVPETCRKSLDYVKLLLPEEVATHIVKESNLYAAYCKSPEIILQQKHYKDKMAEDKKNGTWIKKRKLSEYVVENIPEQTNQQQHEEEDEQEDEEINGEERLIEDEEGEAEERRSVKSFKQWCLQLPADFVTPEVITIKMLWSYIACTLVMGLQPYNTIDQCWEKRDPTTMLYGNDNIKALMAKNKWKLVHRFLHFDQEWLEERVNLLFQKYYRPCNIVSVDEMMSKFLGKCGFRMFMPLKPIKFGLKYFSLADKRGYTFNFWLYRGSKSQQATDTVSIVIDHLEKLPKDKKFLLGTDNYYGSLTLMKEVIEKFSNIYYISTVRSNRPTWLFTPLAKEAKDQTKKVKNDNGRNRGYSWRSNPDGTISAITIEDNKLVNFISNFISPTVISNDKEILDAQSIYNHCMQCVDIADKKIGEYYLFPHRKTKWTRVYFFMLLKVIIVNAFIIKKSECQDSRMSQMDFIHNVITGIKCQHNVRARRGAPEHTLVKGDKKQTHCKHCKKTGSSVRHYCEKCKVYLHKKCFVEFHSKTSLLNQE